MDFKKTIEDLSNEVALAALTAPKARGTENLIIKIFTGKDIPILSDMMKKCARDRENGHIFERDAENIRTSGAVILFGAKRMVYGLDCGFCGFSDCSSLEGSGGLCSYVPGDLGIALGAAVSRAADMRLDNRIMYTVGYTAVKNGLLGDGAVLAFGLPLSAAAKNPFFDRK